MEQVHPVFPCHRKAVAGIRPERFNIHQDRTFAVPRVIFFPKPLCLFLRKLRGKAENVILKLFPRKTELLFKILCHIEWEKVRRAEKKTGVIHEVKPVKIPPVVRFVKI